jgi:hypothetical protein
MVIRNGESMLGHLMKDAILGVDPSSLAHLRVRTEWIGIQVLTDPFVVYRNDKYLPVILVEELNTEHKYLLFVSATSLAKNLEALRAKRGALIGLNLRIRKQAEDKFSAYEVEELVE